MADNSTLPATGDVIADEDISGVKYQRMKLIDSTVGSTTPVGTTENPLKTAGPDAVSLLSTTVSTVSTTSSVDTTGYGSVVWQLSGVQTFTATVEVSNDNSIWFNGLASASDLPIPTDTLTSDGVWTVKPTGKYMRLRVTQITGTLTVLALGRATGGVNTSDLLAMAMDSQTSTPLYVSGNGAPASLANALPVAIAKEQFEDRFITISGVGMVAGMNACTGNYDWLDVSGYSVAYITYTGTNASSTAYLIEGSNSGAQNTAGASSDNASFGLNGFSVNNIGTAGTPVYTSFGQTNSLATSSATYVVMLAAKYLKFRLSGATLTSGAFVIRLTNKPLGLLAVGTTLGAGTANIGFVTTQYGSGNVGSATANKFTAAASTNAANLKSVGSKLYGWNLYNITASAKFFRFYNKSSVPTVGTDSPAFVIPVPANGSATSTFESGIGFSLGIGIACTGAVADLDTTVTAANDVLGVVITN